MRTGRVGVFPPGVRINTLLVAGWIVLAFHLECAAAPDDAVELRGEVVDADSGRSLAARVYVHDAEGRSFFPRSAHPGGRAIRYEKQRQKSIESHTTLSAHPFRIDLPPGRYRITVEKGKEYFTASRDVILDAQPANVRIPLRRWIDMRRRGWYSGETHVHRSLDELPHLVVAEDLNVAFPLLYWETQAFAAPRPHADAGSAAILIRVDETHVIYPRNTEYEIFRVGDRPHTLGAIFILNHRTVFDRGVPPLGPVVDEARRQGALLELDKHNWPWSMALVPLLEVDLFELANNHHWRAPFTFKTFGEPPPAFMEIEQDAAGMTEDGWTHYGFENYYALLNCGFRLRPTAGSASGVHPVPLGFGRVYVYLGERFSYEEWLRGLDAGRSFVTTGPMLFVEVDGRHPGHVWRLERGASRRYRVQAEAVSPHPIERIELIVNGAVVETVQPEPERGASDAHIARFETEVAIDRSSWLAARCFARAPRLAGDAGDRRRFAHSAPFHVIVAGTAVRPRGEEIGYLIQRVEEQITRSAGVLPPAALEEYRTALEVYRRIALRVR